MVNSPRSCAHSCVRIIRFDVGDLLQLRPSEVIFEEWYLLSLSGVTVPKIAIWQTIAGSDPTAWCAQLM